MNENLNLVEILDGCPKGTKFYSSVFGVVELEEIKKGYLLPIGLRCLNSDSVNIGVDGRLSPSYDGECTLFPAKDQRDWSKFERFWDNPKKERFNPNTLKPYDKVLVRDCNSGNWVCDLFSHIGNKDTYPFYCVSNYYRWCIPYNDDTKHLIGTSESPSKYYRYWEE